MQKTNCTHKTRTNNSMVDKNKPCAFILPMKIRNEINIFKGGRGGVSFFMSSYPQHTPSL